MNVISVTDLDDPRLDPYRDLRREDVRRRGPLFIAEGRLVVQRLLASHYETVSVLAEAKRLPWVAERASAATPVLVISSDGMREVSGFNFHRGLLACGRRISMLPAETLLQEHADAHSPGLSDEVALGAIAVSDAENLGSLIRTAAAFGIDRLVLSRQTIDPLCRRVLRVSMGTALRMRMFDLADPLGWLTENERLGRWFTIATTLEPGAIPLSQVARHPEFHRRPKLVLMGNEGDGLPAELSRACTVRGVIPMAPGIDSLNVAVAGGIAIYELFRHERTGGEPQ
ncbi:MAG: RNA methyltransferase [Planctomycetaceae bacterium]|nr:MAG: RNA methyltransferase [Planctomycetaceae bacterium]